MDSGFLTASDRHENEPSKRQKSSEGQDTISNLPDFIIGHILSFLPIKDAVRTSVLSQRWIYTWTFVSELSFIDKESIYCLSEIEKTRFMNFVCRVLLHLNCASIKTFSLTLVDKYEPYIINQWISSVSNRRVKRISVRSLQECNISCYSIFKCQSLEELVLGMDQSIIQFPSFVRLSSLTVLHLITTFRNGMKVTCYSSNESKELTLNFPVLREYKTQYCTWLGVKCVTLEAPLLKVVVIINSRLTRPDVSHAEIKICASHITKFRYAGIVSLQTILLDAHIAEAEISILTLKGLTVQQMGIFVRKIFSINVERLQLYLTVNQDLAGMKHCLADIPAFGMLCHLQLFYVASEILFSLLLKSPCLQTLVIMVVIESDEEQMNFSIVPDCFLSTLKEVKFDDFMGGKHELSFAKFVMDKGQVLESISFSCSQQLHGAALEKVKEEIFLVKRNFTIEFSAYFG